LQEQADDGTRIAAPSLRIVEIAGAPRERGRQYGEQARAQVESSIAYYSELFGTTHGLSWERIVEGALAWLRPVEEFDGDLAAELHGIAEGAGRDVGEILALNARGEMVYGGYLADPADGCTSYAVLPEASADGHVYGGQNWDWRLAAEDTWVVLRIVQPPKPTVITVVEAGQVGRHGVNSAGLGLFANGLDGFCTPDPRVPQPFIRRRALDARSFADTLEGLLAADQQIAANVLLVHRDGFTVDLETTPERNAWMYADDGILVHGNHYEAFTWAHDGDSFKPLSPDSIYRVRRVRDALGACRAAAAPGGMTDAIAAALSDHFGLPDAVCAHARPEADPLQQWQTLTSSIIDFTTGEWRLAAGIPCENEFQPLPWNIYDEDAGA
jgi:isopenicillin-N N-acyltransferase-like protein